MASQSGYIPSLDGWRAVSILIVVVSHAGFGHIVPGGLGVTIFFFLSGFLITTLLLSEHERSQSISIKHFYIRRFFRLFPSLIVTLIIAYSLVLLRIIDGGVTAGGIASQVLYFANYYMIFFAAENSIPAGTGILWSLAVEEHFYLVYPALLAMMLGLARHRALPVLLGAFCLAVLCWRFYLVYFLGVGPGRTFYATDTRMDSIVFGCIFAMVSRQWDDTVKSKPNQSMTNLDWALLSFSVLLMLVSLLVRDAVFRETFRYTLQGLALMPMFYYSIRYSKKFPFSLLNISWIQRIGIYSYAIYLIHQIIISYLESNVPVMMEVRVLLLVSTLVLAVLYADVLDRFLEPAFRRLRKRYR